MFPYVTNYLEIDELHRDSLRTIAIFSEQFLRFIPRNIKNFPSHGVDHSISIINLINDFCQNWGISLSKEERYLLYCSAWLHDIGCIRERNTHNEVSVDIFMRNDNICDSINNVNERAIANLKWIILAHTSHYPIDKIPEENEKVRLQLISAIFRLMDACEIIYAKCPQVVFKEIEKTLVDNKGEPDREAMEFWNAHMSIRSIYFKKPNIEIVVSDKLKSKKIIEKLNLEIESIRKIFERKTIQVPSILPI